MITIGLLSGHYYRLSMIHLLKELCSRVGGRQRNPVHRLGRLLPDSYRNPVHVRLSIRKAASGSELNILSTQLGRHPCDGLVRPSRVPEVSLLWSTYHSLA